MSIVVNKTRLPVTQWQTESGSVVSISDARKRYAKSLSVALEPIQDLHGYANPWVGGAGKNKCSMADQTFVQYLEVEIDEVPAGTYNYSAVVTSSDTDDTRCAIVFLDADKNTLSAKSLSRSVGGSRISTEFTVSSPLKYLRLYASSGWPSGAGDTASFVDNMICLASATDPTVYAPYKNLCPISGTSSVTVYDDPKYGGKIWWNQLLKIESSDQSAERNGLVFTDNRNGSYTLNGTMESGSNFGRFPISLTKDHVYIISPGSPNVCLTSTMGYSTTFGERLQTATSTAIAIHSFYCPNGRTFNNITTYPNVFDLTEMFGAGNEPTLEQFRALFPKDYYDYNAGTETLVSAVNGDPCWNVSVSLGQTVYGGTLDVVSGVMTVANVYKALAVNDMNNSESYPGWNGFGMRDIFGAGRNIFTSYLCDSFSGKNVGINTAGSNDIIYLSMAQWGVTGQTEFKQVYGGLVFGILFPLATPQTIQLSPNQIEMLMRNNTVWSDAGQVTLEYARIRQ